MWKICFYDEICNQNYDSFMTFINPSPNYPNYN